MFDTDRPEGANQILALARSIAQELSSDTGRTIRVVGWSVQGGKMDQEYVVEIDGQGCNLEVGDSDLRTFPSDQRVRVEVEEHIRAQLRSALKMLAPSSRVEHEQDAARQHDGAENDCG